MMTKPPLHTFGQYVVALRGLEVWLEGWRTAWCEGGWNCLFTPVISPGTQNGCRVIASVGLLTSLIRAASSALW
jgi:hypothetical protein